MNTTTTGIIRIARSKVMEHLPEMVFVLDDKERIVDANAVAQKWLGKPIDQIIGGDPMEVFREWPQLLQRFFFLEYSREEVEIPGDPPRIFEVIITPMVNSSNKVEGRIILAYDITERKYLEKELQTANESLQLQLEENERLRLKLQEQATRDPLTGVFNRRYFAEALDKEAARAERENASFSVFILDVDHFKKYNDANGHLKGDECLRQIAEVLMSVGRRQYDLAARYGGEEFALILPGSTAKNAAKRAETLRKKLLALKIPHRGSPDKCVTVSIGVAALTPTPSTQPADLVAHADQALYDAKKQGRNRVVMFKG